MSARPASVRPTWIAGGVAFVVASATLALVVGPTSIDKTGVLLEAANNALPMTIDSGLTEQQQAIVGSIRLLSLIHI